MSRGKKASKSTQNFVPKQKVDIKIKYQPVYKQAPMDMKYHYYDNDVLKIRPEVATLITSVDELKEFAESCKGLRIAVDTETTGLTYGKDNIVGFSVAKDRYHGIYVPLRHKIRRRDTVQEYKRDENGNVLYRKDGKTPRVQTVKKDTIFDNPANLPVKECLDILYQMMLDAKVTVMHNSEFDLTMIRQEGYDVMKCTTFDTVILTYLYDSENKKWNKLKEASWIVLGRKPMKFAEALGDEENFQYVDLKVGAPYGASDALNTLGIFEELYQRVKELLQKCPQKFKPQSTGEVYNVLKQDNKLIRAFTDYYCHVDLQVNNEEAKIYREMVKNQLAEVEDKIYSYFNKGMFNLSPSSKEYKETMAEYNIITGLKTDTGNVSYGKKGIQEMERNLRQLKSILDNFGDTIEFSDRGVLNKRTSNGLKLANLILMYGSGQFKIEETTNTLKLKSAKGYKLDSMMFFEELKDMYKQIQANMGVLQNCQKRNSLIKALNSYITKLTEVTTCHMRYRLQGTASGRLSSGNGSKNDKKKNHYFIDLNAQNLTKPHSAYYTAEKLYQPGHILGWNFKLVTEEFYHANHDNPEYYFVEGSDPVGNIRNCLVAPAGRYIASLDYSAQEYRALAILSRDRVMINNFLRGLDPHTATAYAVWGEENYDRQKRKKAKYVNFTLNYGGGAYTLANNMDVPLEEAEEILKNYSKTYHQCVSWKQSQIEKCKEHQDGVAYNVFGRPRQFKSRMSSASFLKDPTYQDQYYSGISKEYLFRKGDAMESAVDRRIISHLIQGMCGDICRWDMIRLYDKYFKDRDPHIDFYSTVHDEINFSIDKDHVIKYVREIDDIMTIHDFSEQLPIITSIDLGYTLGVLFPFEWADKDRTELVPVRL
jgi:DNA polymerase I-like protein with 3'-5' exonuclease and polymerase domains